MTKVWLQNFNLVWGKDETFEFKSFWKKFYFATKNSDTEKITSNRRDDPQNPKSFFLVRKSQYNILWFEWMESIGWEMLAMICKCWGNAKKYQKLIMLDIYEVDKQGLIFVA